MCWYNYICSRQATKLWMDLSTMDNVVKVTSLWLRTLETQVEPTKKITKQIHPKKLELIVISWYYY